MHNDNIECQICHKKFRYINNTHLRTHGLTISEYKQRFPGYPTHSETYRNETSAYARGKTYEEILGEEKAKQLKEIRRANAIIQFQDPQQRKIRADIEWSIERRKQMSITMSRLRNDPRLKDSWNEAVKLAIFKNGNFPGRQSKIALEWIYEYLKENNIGEHLCYYHGGGINGDEYYQQIFNPISNKFECGSYDLTILSELNIIDTIIEINGPWHHKLEDVLKDPHSKCCPLSTNKYTKLESYNKDTLKLNKALDISKNVYVFWLYSNELIKIDTKIDLLIL